MNPSATVNLIVKLAKKGLNPLKSVLYYKIKEDNKNYHPNGDMMPLPLKQWSND